MKRALSPETARLLSAVRPHEGLRLHELARELPVGVTVEGDSGTRVRGVRHDSRLVEPGDLFVARKGAQADGTRFIGAAKAAGAAAVMAARGTMAAEATEGLPLVLVDDLASGLAFAAAAVYGHPGFGLETVGITGTNGKTTTAHLVKAAIDGAVGEPKTGTVGTVGHGYGSFFVPGEHTTPEADEIARVMAAMRLAGAEYVAMEVSSIALALGRARAVRFRVAAFTNLTQDHLDFHGTMDAYAEAKALLFVDHAPGAAVLNVDDPFGYELSNRVRAPIVRVSAKVDARGADLFPRRLEVKPDGIEALVRTPEGDVELTSSLVGRHNAENLLVALGVIVALELDIARAAAALGREGAAPGRLERCDGDVDDIIVLVDYAHTPDAISRALSSVRAPAPRRVICVFGCGGDRDATKRPIMGEMAGALADVVFVTNDNPRTEAPEAIASAIEEGLSRAMTRATARDLEAADARGVYAVELDRARAIERAVLVAAPGDTVLIAGKGHETYQIVGRDVRPFDDREEAKRALALRRAQGRLARHDGGGAGEEGG
jgi:UDP-N-acetylmuramoyl-L-alanyl-D-glutamate--2,6-diaminopimelate ligase